MTILQIEHPVGDFDAWKNAFDGDPVGREQGGVRSYRIYRPADDPNYVIVDLELDGMAEAEAFLGRLRGLWSRAIAQGLIQDPRARILEITETVDI
jgi:hypothetical protein